MICWHGNAGSKLRHVHSMRYDPRSLVVSQRLTGLEPLDNTTTTGAGHTLEDHDHHDGRVTPSMCLS